MTERFIKYIPSDKAKWLRRYYPNAYLLLSYIAEIARRKIDFDDGLKIGDAIIGEKETPKQCGIGKKAYRIAIEKLEELKIIEIVFNPEWSKKSYLMKCKKNNDFPKMQKRAIKRAIKSKVVNLIESDIWDINPEIQGDQKGDQGAIKGRQTRTKKNEKEVRIKENETKEKVIPLTVSFPFLKEKENELGFRISEKYTNKWFNHYGEETYSEALAGLQRNKKTIDNHEAWMTKTLEAIHNKKLNITFILEFITKYRINYLTVNKNYVTDSRTGNDYQFKLPHENFKEIINQKFENELGSVS